MTAGTKVGLAAGGALALVAVLAAAGGSTTGAKKPPSKGVPMGAYYPPTPATRSLLLTSRYGRRTHPTSGAEGKMHYGVDIGVPSGTPVYAPADGEVVDVWPNHASAGNAIHVTGGPYRWAFMHLSRIDVKPGARVRRGQQIGLSGATGDVSGPHLHLEARNAEGQTVDPEGLFPVGTFRRRGEAPVTAGVCPPEHSGMV